MAKNARVHVVSHGDGWVVKSSRGQTGIFRTRDQAVAEARRRLRGGGDVVVHGRDGRIRDVVAVGKGRAGREIKDPPGRGRLTGAQIRDAVWNASKALRG